MNLLRIKGLIYQSDILNSIAEVILDIYISLRYRITGSYTKNKEDVIVFKLLGKKQVKYVDIGANHYKRGNNTYLFYTMGNTGCLIEANPYMCKKLEKKRTKDKIINAAVGEKSGEGNIPFYILNLETRSSIDKSSVDESLANGLQIKQIIDIPCININALLEEMKFFPDYLSIDIEGMDYKVLRTLDFDKWKIKVIVAEKSTEINAHGLTMDEYMRSKGYEVVSDRGSNVIYYLQN